MIKRGAKKRYSYKAARILMNSVSAHVFVCMLVLRYPHQNSISFTHLHPLSLKEVLLLFFEIAF